MSHPPKSKRTPLKLRLYYDQHCGLCRYFSAILLRLDKRKNIQLIPLATLSAHGIDPSRAAREMSTIDKNGVVHYGFESVYAIFLALPGYWWLRPLLSMLRITRLGHLVYLLIARNRRRCKLL